MNVLRLLSVLAVTMRLGAVARAEAPSPLCTLDRATGTTIDRTPFLAHGYGLRWSSAAHRLAFMEPGPDGYFRIYTSREDGSDRRAITADRPEIPTKHQGVVSWHPSGDYLLFTAQKPQWSGPKHFGVPDYEALPGFGRHDDLWLIAANGAHAWKLTDETNSSDEGLLIPIFSPDGKHIAWSARQPGGSYALQVAEFELQPEPHIANVRTFLPGGPAYYEPGSFTGDGKSLVYTSDHDTHSFWQSQLYRLDLESGKTVRLTTGRFYNEHPTVVSTPTGEWVIYMSSRGVDRFRFSLALGTDWYAVKLDGSGTKRLTTMNVDKPGNPQNFGEMQVAGTVAIAPGGDFMYGDIQDSLVKQTGFVRRVQFSCP